MVTFRSATIKQKLAWMSAIASTTALLLAASAFFAYHLITFRSSIVRTLTIQADTIGLNSVSALRFNDERAAEDTLSALRADRNINAATVYSADGRLFAAYTGQARDRSAIAPAIAPGQADFARGAMYSPHGKAFIVLPSTALDGQVSRIRGTLSQGSVVTTLKFRRQ